MINNATEQASALVREAWRDGAVPRHRVDAIRATRETRPVAPILSGDAMRAAFRLIGAVELRFA